MRASLFLLSLLGASLGGCYQVDEPVCAYACGVGSDGGGKSCPRNYECRGDNYCHKVGTTAACEYSDASVIDQAVVSADFSSIDQDSADLSLSDASSD